MSVTELRYKQFTCDQSGKTVVVKDAYSGIPKGWVEYKAKLPTESYEQTYYFATKELLSKWLNRQYQDYVRKELKAIGDRGALKHEASNQLDLDEKLEVFTIKAPV